MSGFLRRYTELPYLLQMLQTEQITLLNSRAWDDKNDAYYLEVYRRRRSLGSVLVLCLTGASETYHHWRVFAPGTSGVCIEFDKDRFRRWAAGQKGLRLDEVDYRKLRTARDRPLETSQLPFIKRYPFRDEQEHRLICDVKKEDLNFKGIDFDLSMIRKIIVNPWLPQPVFETVREAMAAVNLTRDIRIVRTTLVNNEEWKQLADKRA